MIIAIGSLNRIKVDAVKASFTRLYPAAVIRGVAVESGVPDQPWGDDEIIRGAINRAKLALGVIGADLGVGLEAGIIRNEFGYFTNAWCAICDSNGQVSLGGGFNVELPAEVIRRLEAGADLGQAINTISSSYNHSEVGAIGILTNNFINRQCAYENIVICAMARHIRNDVFAKRGSNEKI